MNSSPQRIGTSPVGLPSGHVLSPVARRGLVALLLSAFAALCFHGLAWDSPTVDEFAHLPAGYAYWRTGDLDLYSGNPPLVKLIMALPLLAMDPPPALASPSSIPDGGGWRPQLYGTDFMERNRERYRTIFLLGRLPIVGLGLLLGLLVHRWARDLYGEPAGLVALALYAFCPSFVAHAHLATIDVGAALFSTLALYLFWRFTERPGGGRLAACGVALGLAQLAKFSAVLLYPLLAALAALLVARGGALPPSARWRGRSRWLGAAMSLGAVTAISVAVIWVGYLGRGVGRPLGELPFHSRAFTRAQALAPGVPAPLPGPFLRGLDELGLYGEAGEFPTYLLGRWSQRGFRSYYLLSLLLKTPLPLLLAWLAAPWLPRRHRRGEVFLLLPAAALVALMSTARLGYGIRYLLPALPLLMVYAARAVPALAPRRRLALAAAAVLLLYPVSVTVASPDTIDYFNPLLRGPADGVFLDSNLDWGQGLERLHAELGRRGLPSIGLVYFGHVDPALYGISAHRPDPRVDRLVAVSANFLRGYPYVTYRDGAMRRVTPESVAWLAEQPREVYLGGGIWLVRVEPGSSGSAEAGAAPR